MLGHSFRFVARNPSKGLELGQTEAGTGFGALKIGGHHVVSPWAHCFCPKGPLPGDLGMVQEKEHGKRCGGQGAPSSCP